MEATDKARETTLNELQRLVDEWIRTYGVRYFDPLTNMAIDWYKRQIEVRALEVVEDLIHHLLRGLSRAVVLLHDEVAG